MSAFCQVPVAKMGWCVSVFVSSKMKLSPVFDRASGGMAGLIKV